MTAEVSPAKCCLFRLIKFFSRQKQKTKPRHVFVTWFCFCFSQEKPANPLKKSTVRWRNVWLSFVKWMELKFYSECNCRPIWTNIKYCSLTKASTCLLRLLSLLLPIIFTPRAPTGFLRNGEECTFFRVLQKNLVYVVGLSPRIAETETLKKPEYFGKYGRIHKVVVGAASTAQVL